MNSIEIDKILSANPVTKKHYMGCYPSDTIPSCRKYPSSMVINFDEADQPGTHWVALFAPSKRRAIFFDSYGTEGVKNIQDYLNKKFWFVTRQTFNIQEYNSTVCGHYALYFIYMCSRGVPFFKIQKSLSGLQDPDGYVKRFVNARMVRGLY